MEVFLLILNDTSPIEWEKNEPPTHHLISNSFVFVPSAGMRLAPEILLLELFREVFYQSHSENGKTKDLFPNEKTDDQTYYYNNGERAVLYALKGRRKKTKQSKNQPFFTPAYPELARNAWLGNKRERIIVNFLFGRSVGKHNQEHTVCAPISQYFWSQGETQAKKLEHQNFINIFFNALVGNNSCQGNNNDRKGKEILSATIVDSLIDFEEIAKKNIYEKTTSTSVIKIPEDKLSSRIFNDLTALCELEKNMPRLQWLYVFMTFLRFSLPIWLLAQMRITSLIHAWLIDAIDFGKIPSQQLIEKKLTDRYKGLLHPTLTPSREIFEHTEQYIKHRVEINISFYLLEKIVQGKFQDRLAKLEVNGAGNQVVTIEQLLILSRDHAFEIKNHSGVESEVKSGKFADMLTRIAERSAAWRDPLKKGQGKNIDEFFRVLYRDNVGDELGGYLLMPEGRGSSRGFRVFPGQLLLKTITILANYEKHQKLGGGGKLVLEDVENHFFQYGIDFDHAADARPQLISELQAMGLLKGSPDAGSSVAVACPY